MAYAYLPIPSPAAERSEQLAQLVGREVLGHRSARPFDAVNAQPHEAIAKSASRMPPYGHESKGAGIDPGPRCLYQQKRRIDGFIPTLTNKVTLMKGTT